MGHRPAGGGLGLLLKVKRSKVSDLLCLFVENASYTEFLHWLVLFVLVGLLCVSFVFPLRGSYLKKSLRFLYVSHVSPQVTAGCRFPTLFAFTVVWIIHMKTFQTPDYTVIVQIYFKSPLPKTFLHLLTQIKNESSLCCSAKLKHI